jgi:hypothetical protein
MDTATYAAAAALPGRVIEWLERSFVPEADFVAFNLSEVALQTREHFIACSGTNEVLRKFDRETRWVAAGLLSILLLVALVFVVLFPEGHSMTVGFSERASQTESGSSPAENAATLLRNTVPESGMAKDQSLVNFCDSLNLHRGG